MTQQEGLQVRPIHTTTLFKAMFTGAAIGLIVILFFVIGGQPKPEWGKFWMIRPLIITPIAAAMGGAFFYFINHLLHKPGWRKVLVIFIGVIGFVIALWLGIVLGLDGTMWN